MQSDGRKLGKLVRQDSFVMMTKIAPGTRESELQELIKHLPRKFHELSVDFELGFGAAIHRREANATH